MKELGPKNMHFLHICKIGQDHGFWTITASFLSFYQNKISSNVCFILFPEILTDCLGLPESPRVKNQDNMMTFHTNKDLKCKKVEIFAEKSTIKKNFKSKPKYLLAYKTIFGTPKFRQLRPKWLEFLIKCLSTQKVRP